MVKHDFKQCSQPAFQAALRPIDNSRFFVGGLTDGLTRSQTCQIWLSDASRAIWSAFLLLSTVSIHNFSLYILFSENSASLFVQLSQTCLLRDFILSADTDKSSGAGTVPTNTRTNVRETERILSPSTFFSFFFFSSGQADALNRLGCLSWWRFLSFMEVWNKTQEYYRDKRPSLFYTCAVQRKEKQSVPALPSPDRSLRGAKVVTRTALSAFLKVEVCQ